MRAGLHVYVEKPPSLTAQDALEMAKVSKETGKYLQVGFMKRFAPANVVAKEYIQSEAFGDISSITLIHACGPYDDMRRMLLFNGIHMLDLGRFLGSPGFWLGIVVCGLFTTAAIFVRRYRDDS